MDNKLVYTNAFIVGFIIMAFEMLGSRYLNPYFGSGILTWASLISVVMIAMAIGYFLGGFLADKFPSSNVLGCIIIVSALWLFMIPLLSDKILHQIFYYIEDPKYGSLIGASAILLFPLTLLSVYSPYSIRLVISHTEKAGSIAGRMYGISTIGSVLGTLVTTFYLIPVMGTKKITFSLAVITIITGFSFLLKNRKALPAPISASIVIIILAFSTLSSDSYAKDRLNTEQLVGLSSGLIEHKESLYNDIYITKKENFITMSFRRYGGEYEESVRDLRNPFALPVPYTQFMTIGLAYNTKPNDVIMLGLGGGATTKYIQEYYPETKIKAVELDPDVSLLAKKYFNIVENENFDIEIKDARIFLTRSKDRYDLIMMDTFRGGYIPFHLLTVEFFNIVKRRMRDNSFFVVNLHDGTRLFSSTINTLKRVFKNVDMYGSKAMGNVIIVAYDSDFNADGLLESAHKIQSEKGFTYPLNLIAKHKIFFRESTAEILTDDFAPVNVLNEIRRKNQPRW